MLELQLLVDVTLCSGPSKDPRGLSLQKDDAGHRTRLICKNKDFHEDENLNKWIQPFESLLFRHLVPSTGKLKRMSSGTSSHSSS